MARALLPNDVKSALIEVCGRCFWYKQPLFDMFSRAGIPEDLYLKHEQEPKFKIARLVTSDLEAMGDEGLLLQRRLVTELCKLKDVPDRDVPDRDAGLQALRRLKEAAHVHDLVAREAQSAAKTRLEGSLQAHQRTRERDRRLGELFAEFSKLTVSPDAQGRGYGLEDLLKELFALYEIRYRKSYKADGEQIDGFFAFDGFDYLVEARWRKEKPSLQDLLAFKGKVDRKIESTRGMVVSIQGFDHEVVSRLREAGPANLILIDGLDLTLLLEGRVSLTDGLQAKIERAAQEGNIYFSLARFAR